MWDFVIGGLIGGGFSLSAIWLQSYFSGKTTKLQIRAQSDEKYLERLVTYRANYLKPINDSLSQSYELLNKIVGIVIKMQGKYGKSLMPDSFTDEYHQEVLEIEKLEGNIVENIREMRPLMAKTSDTKLNDDYLKLFEVYLPLQKVLSKKWVFDSDSKLDNETDFDSLMQRIGDFSEVFRRMNKRIENLMCGAN